MRAPSPGTAAARYPADALIVQYTVRKKDKDESVWPKHGIQGHKWKTRQEMHVAKAEAANQTV